MDDSVRYYPEPWLEMMLMAYLRYKGLEVSDILYYYIVNDVQQIVYLDLQGIEHTHSFSMDDVNTMLGSMS